MSKKCSKCKIEKTDDNYDKSKITKNGLYSTCKSCRKEYREKNKELLKSKNKEYYDKIKNTEEHKNKAKEYYLKNRSKKIKYAKEYFERNRSEVINRQNVWSKRKQEYDHSFKLTNKIRRIIRRTLEGRKSKSIEYIGVSSVEDFIRIMTDKCDNKNWIADNYHLDHIWQVHWFSNSLKDNPEEISKLIHHHKNLRPIPKEENCNRPKNDFSCLDLSDFPIYEKYLNSNILENIKTHFKLTRCFQES